MPIAEQPPVRNPAASRERTRHVFARLMDGQSTAAIAAAEGLGVRRVQQIVAAELARREANPAEDYVLMQVARLERALDLLGGQIEAGKGRGARPPPFTAQTNPIPAPPPPFSPRPPLPSARRRHDDEPRWPRSARRTRPRRAGAPRGKQNNRQPSEKTDSFQTAHRSHPS